jgi:hypothetical protein
MRSTRCPPAWRRTDAAHASRTRTCTGVGRGCTRRGSVRSGAGQKTNQCGALIVAEQRLHRHPDRDRSLYARVNHRAHPQTGQGPGPWSARRPSRQMNETNVEPASAGIGCSSPNVLTQVAGIAESGATRVVAGRRSVTPICAAFALLVSSFIPDARSPPIAAMCGCWTLGRLAGVGGVAGCACQPFAGSIALD